MSVIICLTIDEIQSSFRSKVHIILRTELQNWAFLLTIWVESFTHWVWHFCQETSNNPSKVQRIWQRNFRMFQIQEFLQLYECFSKREWGDSVVSEIKGWEDAFYKFLSLLFNHGFGYWDYKYHESFFTMLLSMDSIIWVSREQIVSISMPQDWRNLTNLYKHAASSQLESSVTHT